MQGKPKGDNIVQFYNVVTNDTSTKTHLQIYTHLKNTGKLHGGISAGNYSPK